MTTESTTPLEGRVAVITGASSGIGAALAAQLYAQGVRLGLLSRAGSDLGLAGALGIACDVRSADAVEDAVARVAAELGVPDIVVANAGVGHYADFVDTPLERSVEMIETNLLGTVHLYRSTVPRLLDAGVQGDLVTVASEAGRRGFPGEAVYCASKFGQVGLSRALDGELREKGIRVTVLCPGGVHTEFAVGDGRGRSHDDPTVQSMMTAEDVANLAVYAVTRPRGMRLTELALRPMSEAIWG
ncbi:SDR family NAD(P)-dependent oxidoreductase [Georgenia sp. EYE_87]|uniref:SDR family oxidoreductase n=1 Tax=Georgenia sp. EYE_87 TaxID=2853448 RepID=UPI0020043FA8|nr:SDR family NAD(P)-dependent oxidoreductase [Georgenia sp. EYE_87]MCK6210879.1 SDR family NAD(P)-dependent oxidoreductase [Georgenia sp. EYE_87]